MWEHIKYCMKNQFMAYLYNTDMECIMLKHSKTKLFHKKTDGNQKLNTKHSILY